jgi:hypothetical protein
MRTKVKFVRRGTVVMTGGAEIEVDDPDDYSTIYEKGYRKEFLSFLPTEITYDNEEWEFSPLFEEPKDDSLASS